MALKKLNFKIPIKLWFKEKGNKKDVSHYPCLCEAISSVLFWNRLFGILPVVASKCNHIDLCKFEISTWWMMYSYILQALFIPYTVTAATSRLTCGPNTNHSTGSDWYVMTFGYIITDIDTVIVVVFGVISAKEICRILEVLAVTPGPIGELRRLQKIMKVALILTFFGFFMVLCSFSYVAWIRFNSQHNLDLFCYMLDKPVGVMIRGSTLIFPGIHILLVILLCLLVSSKFERLAETTLVTLEGNIEILYPNSEVATTVEQTLPSATIQGV